MHNTPFLRPVDAARFIGAGLSTFWRYAKYDPTFPKSRKISSRLTVFNKNELADWVNSHTEVGVSK